MYKINGIEIVSKETHQAIVSRIVDYAVDECRIYEIIDDEMTSGRYISPNLLPQRIFDISVSRETGVLFKVIYADGREQNCSLGTAEVRDLENAGWM